jgi:hypothetical protein
MEVRREQQPGASLDLPRLPRLRRDPWPPEFLRPMPRPPIVRQSGKHPQSMTPPPRFIACVGRLAHTNAIEIELDCNRRDRRLLIVGSDNECRLLLGLRAPDTVYVDMDASWYQRAFCKLREIPEITIEQARELLKTPQEGIPAR